MVKRVKTLSNNAWYDVVRRTDGAIIYSFPAEGRHLLYKINGVVSVRPMLSDEEIFTLNGFMRLAEKLGYRIIPPSDNM